MCQLLGVSSLTPIRMSFSWERFAMRGSKAAGNPDGWGVAYAEKTDVHILREPSPAADSPMVAFLKTHGPASTTVVSHVRHATIGSRDLANTQPFDRVLGGKRHIFAHNGHVPTVEAPSCPWLRPVGSTDSEKMFCMLLSRLEHLWRVSDAPPLELRRDIVSTFAAEMRSIGAANFLYFDGITLFAHGHRHTIPGDGISDEPGLYLLRTHESMGVNGHTPCDGLESIGRCEAQTLVATIPLDDQPWRPFTEGELICLEHGARV